MLFVILLSRQRSHSWCSIYRFHRRTRGGIPAPGTSPIWRGGYVRSLLLSSPLSRLLTRVRFADSRGLSSYRFTHSLHYTLNPIYPGIWASVEPHSLFPACVREPRPCWSVLVFVISSSSVQDFAEVPTVWVLCKWVWPTAPTEACTQTKQTGAKHLFSGLQTEVETMSGNEHLQEQCLREAH